MRFSAITHFQKTLLMVLAGVVLIATRGESQVGAGASFDKGKTRLSLMGGWGQAFDQDYFVIGAGAGYYVLPGLEVGIDGESWVGNSPKIYKVTPEARYIFTQTGTSVFPYLGGFYRRTIYEDLEDADSVGGRVGVYMPLSQRTYFGIGGVFERQLDCNTDIYSHCSVVYPEFAFTVGF